MKYLVTGAGRPNGLGAEMVRQLVAAGHEVHATARDPRQAAFLDVKVHALDVTDEGSIAALAKQFDSLDVLINNAGMMELDRVGELRLQALLDAFAVNAAAPVLLTQALLPALLKGDGKLAVHVSSKMGSITDNTSGGYYGYRMSKAALNMGSRSLALDLRPRGIASVVVHPGWVKTDMGGANAPLSGEVAMRRLLAVIAKLRLSDSGKFYSYDGQQLPF